MLEGPRPKCTSPCCAIAACDAMGIMQPTSMGTIYSFKVTVTIKKQIWTAKLAGRPKCEHVAFALG